eukprot:2771022-Prymnesium_polylepis.1
MLDVRRRKWRKRQPRKKREVEQVALELEALMKGGTPNPEYHLIDEEVSPRQTPKPAPPGGTPHDTARQRAATTRVAPRPPPSLTPDPLPHHISAALLFPAPPPHTRPPHDTTT